MLRKGSKRVRKASELRFRYQMFTFSSFSIALNRESPQFDKICRGSLNPHIFLCELVVDVLRNFHHHITSLWFRFCSFPIRSTDDFSVRHITLKMFWQLPSSATKRFRILLCRERVFRTNPFPCTSSFKLFTFYNC